MILRRLGLWAVFAFLVCRGAALEAQPTIDHSGLDCMRPGRFVVVLSGIDPEHDIQTAKVYFRSRLYRDFYYVEMTYRDGEFVGILPQPSEDTPAVVYYLEALDSAYNTTRSPEYEAEVEDRCRQEPAAAYFPGGDPGITVGATATGASSIPPGFAAFGIIRTITAAGVVSGGGIGAGAAVAVGAAAAAGAGVGVGVLSAGDDSTTTTVVAGAPTSSIVPTSSVPAGSTTSTAGTGSSTSTSTVAPGSSTSTTPDGPPTTSVPPLEASCFTVSVEGQCGVRVDASCVALPVERYEWVLDLTNRWKRIDIPDGPVSLAHTWSDEDCDVDETLRFRLKVRRNGVDSVAHKNLFVPGADAPTASPGTVRVSLESHLAAPGSWQGRLLVNGTLVRTIDNSAPVAISVPGRRGTNTLTAVVASAPGQAGTWRFALDRVVPGSLRVVSGNVLAAEPSAVVFRVSGHVGEQLELTFVPSE